MIFNTQFANQNLIKTSIINYLMYLISSPIVYLSAKLRLTPNMLTTFSILFSFLSIYFLYNDLILVFQISWFFALMLDYSDGPLARKTKNFSSGFNYDHLSDLFKISCLTAALAMFHKDFSGIIMSYIFIFLLLFNETISHSEGAKNKFSNQTPIVTTYFFNKLPLWLVKILQQFYNTVFVFHGHSLLLFLIMPKSLLILQLILSYLSVLLLKAILIKLIY